jgi:hypothetical protein
MDRSEPALPKQTVRKLAWTGGRASILGQGLPLLDCHERRRNPGQSV